jgi:hypothetical protein
MASFNKKFMGDSPIKQVAKGRVERLKARAQRRSGKSGETGGYDYEDPKVLKLLNKASRIEKRNNIKDSGFVKGKKTKGREFGEDTRVSASFERPDEDSAMNYGSPFNSTVTPAVVPTADTYYADRDLIDMSDMYEAFGGGNNEKKTQVTKQKQAKKEDPVEDLYKKVQAENQAKIDKSQKDLEKQNTRTKTLQETTTMKWIPNSEGSTQGSFQRVDAKGNIYTPEPGKEYKKIFDPQAVVKSIMR